MAWVLTWFAHDLQHLHKVARLYDVLLGAHPTLILYICAAVSPTSIMAADKDVQIFAHVISDGVGVEESRKR